MESITRHHRSGGTLALGFTSENRISSSCLQVGVGTFLQLYAMVPSTPFLGLGSFGLGAFGGIPMCKLELGADLEGGILHMWIYHGIHAKYGVQ